MAMYKQINDDTLILSQQAIYGSSRLGVLEREEVISIDSSIHPQNVVIPDPLTENVTHWSRGHKRYELTNHLGNVLATVSDRKLPVYANNSFSYYKAEVMTANDYYAFGMVEPKRSFEAEDSIQICKTITDSVEIVIDSSNFDNLPAVWTVNDLDNNHNFYPFYNFSDVVQTRTDNGRLLFDVAQGLTTYISLFTNSQIAGKTYYYEFDLDLNDCHLDSVALWFTGQTYTLLASQDMHYDQIQHVLLSYTVPQDEDGNNIMGFTFWSSQQCMAYLDNFKVWYNDTSGTHTECVVEARNGEYRFGYNTQLKDDEIYGKNNAYSAPFWEYDPRVVKRWNVDPKAIVGISPYATFTNNPISFIDVDGLYPIYFLTRAYAPFKTFGPGDQWYGDNRGATLNKGASYRAAVSINYDTETKLTQAFGGHTRSHTVDGTKDAISTTKVDDRTKSGSDFIDVHSAGRNEAQTGSWDIDQFTKLKVTTSGDIKTDHILNIAGTISGDDFPNQESMIYDSKGNTLWLGNYETKGDRELGPVIDLAGSHEENVNININIRIKVNKDGVFQGVMQTGKDGKETMITIDDWNKKFKSDDNK